MLNYLIMEKLNEIYSLAWDWRFTNTMMNLSLWQVKGEARPRQVCGRVRLGFALVFWG